MAYINSKTLRRQLLVAIISYPGIGQRAEPTEPILERPESYQRQFVSDYLRDGNRTGYVDGYSKDTDHNRDFQFLTQRTKWALPLAEARLREWLAEPEKNRAAIENVVHSFEYAGTIESFDVIARLFKGRPELRRWIVQSLHTRFGAPEPNGFTKFYHALEYSDPQIRKIARDTFLSLLYQPLSENNSYVWGGAMVERYKHEPTALEIAQDPLVALAKLKSPEHNESLRQKLAKTSKEMHIRKQEAMQKKVN